MIYLCKCYNINVLIEWKGPQDGETIDLPELKFNTEGLEVVDPNRYKLYDVDEQCELGSFMAKCDVPFRIGSIYYEFFREKEDITEDKKIVLQNDNVLRY